MPPLSSPESTSPIVEHIENAYYRLDSQWYLTYIHPAVALMWGMKRYELLGKKIWDLFPHLIGTDIHKKHLKVAKTGEPVSVTAETPMFRLPLEIRISPDNGGISVCFRRQK